MGITLFTLCKLQYLKDEQPPRANFARGGCYIYRNQVRLTKIPHRGSGNILPYNFLQTYFTSFAYKGNFPQSSATSAFTSSKQASLSLMTLTIRRAIVRASSSFMPRVVMAGVPTRRPEVTKGFWVSKGMAFLLAVMCTSSSIFSSSLPVTPVSVMFNSTRWFSVPPATIFTPSLANSSALAEACLTRCA